MRGGWQQPLPDMPAPPPARAWRRLDAPPGYEAQWRRLAEAALELGLGPEQLGETGLDPLAAAAAGSPPPSRCTGRSPATAASRCRGWPPRNLIHPSWSSARSSRCAARTRSTCGPWPGARWRWHGRRRSGRSGRCAATRCAPPPAGCVVATDDGEWAVPGALTAWHAWETVRDRFPALATSPWVLPALRRGPGLDSQIGGRLSNQALQVTFTKHAAAPPSTCGRPRCPRAWTPWRSWRRSTGSCPTTPTVGWRSRPVPAGLAPRGRACRSDGGPGLADRQS